MCYMEMHGYDLSMWKVGIFQDVHYSYEFLLLAQKYKLNGKLEWDSYNSWYVHDESCPWWNKGDCWIKKIVQSGKTHSAQGRCSTPRLLNFLIIT